MFCPLGGLAQGHGILGIYPACGWRQINPVLLYAFIDLFLGSLNKHFQIQVRHRASAGRWNQSE